MSTTSVQSVPLSVLLSWLAVEKEQTRKWLRAEMNRLVHLLVDSIFDSITNKLVNAGWDRERNAGERSQVNPLDHVESPNHQSHQPSSLNAQPSTSTYYPHSIPQHSIIGYEQENDSLLLAQVKQEIKEEEYELTNPTQTNQDCNEYEGDDMNDQVGHIALSHQVNSSIITPSTNDYNRLILNTDHYGQFGNQLTNNATDNDNSQQDWDEPEMDEGEDGQMMQKEEKDDGVETDEVVDYNEDGEDDESMENVPIETTLPHSINGQTLDIGRQSAGHLKRKQNEDVTEQKDTEEEEVEDEVEVEEDEEEEITSRSVKRARRSHPPTLSNTKQIITHSLQCHQVGCELVFAQVQLLTAHLWDGHTIGAYRCLVKNCTQSFTNKLGLGHHLAQSHQSTNQWHCDKCDKQFPSYLLLSQHTIKLHQLGHFECSVSTCTFTGENRLKVFNHYARQHKTQPVNKCHHSDCSFESSNITDLKRHQLIHLGIKPYRCKWSHCGYASTRRFTTITHIRRMHLARNSSSQPNGAHQQDDDPNDYLEEVNELL